MESDGVENNKNLLDEIERRFQFTIIVSLFLDSAWSLFLNKFTIFVGTFKNTSFVVLVASYVFLSYLIFEVFKKKLRNKILNFISSILLVFSFCLIVVIGFSPNQNMVEAFNWYYFTSSFALLGIMFLPLSVIFLTVGGNLYAWLKRS
ncbi:MAG: hypothetical protein RJA61_97 [Candidatus Parcubacteria bacterium]|jgi:hypothetical protein